MLISLFNSIVLDHARADAKWSVPFDTSASVEGLAVASGIPSWILRAAVGEAVVEKCLRDAADMARTNCVQHLGAAFLNVEVSRETRGGTHTSREPISIPTPLSWCVRAYLDGASRSTDANRFGLYLAKFLPDDAGYTSRFSEAYSPDFVSALREYCEACATA